MAIPLPSIQRQKEEVPGAVGVDPGTVGDTKTEATADRAYRDWQRRGRPIGTPETDWFHAEEEVSHPSSNASGAIATRANPSESGQRNSPPPAPANKRYLKQAAVILLVMVAAAGAYLLWRHFRTKDLGRGFASGNGRIEAVELDVAAKSAGRIREIFANDGDFVTAGQVVAKMDSDVLQAQLQQATAQEVEARNAVAATLAIVDQRESERGAALAVVTQREAEQVVAEKTALRSQVLSSEHATSLQEYENDVARQQETAAAVLTAKAQVAASQAAIFATRAQVLEAKAHVDAAISAEKQLQVEIADGELKAARDGRVQFRIAQPGEVVGAGGKVLSMVDLSDVSMTFFLPETVAGHVAIGSEVHIILDAAPENVIPATVTFVANVAQFTPKTVETQSERENLVFRIKATIAPALLRRYISQVKSGLPGVAYVHLDPSVPWPEKLTTRIQP